ncbi:hypothetical protein EW146_g702 [Bondarzewia mesenterica]|uniref:Uncharacterized protein n=1 Tax=Bondarzewia mesenterica TaxID=1095465 RepID=A0A4V3XGA6_9AGAM|nr:hypothetical protein EW146_g702 [Bondarzewia mesenterica]
MLTVSQALADSQFCYLSFHMLYPHLEPRRSETFMPSSNTPQEKARTNCEFVIGQAGGDTKMPNVDEHAHYSRQRSTRQMFSRAYRHAAKRIEPYFPRHVERDVYVSLLQKSDPPTPEILLKAALIRRAMTDITRFMRLREDKPALQNLLQKGSVGDDLWNSLLAAEKELEAEIMEVVLEANTFVEGWGQIILQSAGEMIGNEKSRSIFESIPHARTQNELKYGGGKKAKHVAAPLSPPASPAPTPRKIPASPSSNGLAPSPSAGADSIISSDLEGHTTPNSSPRTPSKSAKKSKKRK